MNASMLQVTSAQIRLLALVAAAGERGSAMHFLEFFAPIECLGDLLNATSD
jgi:hypothetical protein